jgi:Amt family ammonium transporter
MFEGERGFKVGVWIWLVLLGTSLSFAWAAESTPPDIAQMVAELKVMLDTVWVLLTAFLVFFMNLGFALVESGLTRSKNTVNILAKNFIVFAVSSLSFYVIGWGLMFGDGNALFGTEGLFFANGADNSPAMGDTYAGVYGALNWTGVPLWAKFFFQLVFAGTAATIVSGAVAERIKFHAFIIFSFVMVGIIYPITGHWIWGGGWLAKLGMFDFAGSTVVHSVGGWAALAGAVILGPRLGKYTRDGRINPIPGHNLSTATAGGLILWFGWFGFNPGSTMAASFADIARIAVTTNTAASTAAFTATLAAWLMIGKPDLTMIINGALAGLVAITASCAFVSVGSSAIIGAIAGVLVVAAVLFFDRIRVDDPVGAISVHLVNGVFGTLCVGLFAQDLVPKTTGDGLFFGGGTGLLMAQLAGIVTVGICVFAISAITWLIIKATVGIRVSEEEEIEGLDLGEHGISAYPDFPTTPSLLGHGSTGRAMGSAIAYEAASGGLAEQPRAEPMRG